jgi:hypothetical protein
MKVTYPDGLANQSIPPIPKEEDRKLKKNGDLVINDALYMHQLYGITSPQTLGKPASFPDKPDIFPEVRRKWDGVEVVFSVAPPKSKEGWLFEDWLVVFNEETLQYEIFPIDVGENNGWTLLWDTSTPGPWEPKPTTRRRGEPVQKPTELNRPVTPYMVLEVSLSSRTTMRPPAP